MNLHWGILGHSTVRVQAEGAVLSKHIGQNREECNIFVVWASESENRRNVKSNFEVILPLIFVAFTKDSQSSSNKKEQWEHCLWNYHMHIIYQRGEASNEYIRRVVLIPFVFVIKYQPCQITQKWIRWAVKASSHISLIQQVLKINSKHFMLATGHISDCTEISICFFLTPFAGASSCPQGNLMKEEQNKDKKRNVSLQHLLFYLINHDKKK